MSVYLTSIQRFVDSFRRVLRGSVSLSFWLYRFCSAFSSLSQRSLISLSRFEIWLRLLPMNPLLFEKIQSFSRSVDPGYQSDV
jgi:hypothetical protein